MITYSNPILPGFHPDPSICRVGEDFYLVTSSFEYFPGIPIFHSKDLLHWEQIGHVLTRDSQITLVKGAPNCINIYAPTIRYHEGLFYLIVTNVTGDNHGNFIVTAEHPEGPWSDPIQLPFPGIDPSLFFDEDGKTYYIGTDGCIYLQELDIPTGTALGEKHYVWNGTGANNPEGPHVYHIGEYYYILLAQGGTELCHMSAIARSKDLFGPYESCPHNPVLTNIGQCYPIKACGHSDLVEDTQGNWWAVCLGIRPLGYPFRHNMGRETMLVPVEWENGWPIMGDKSAVLPEFTLDRTVPEFSPEGYVVGSNTVDDFKGELPLYWNRIYNPVEGLIVTGENGLELRGNKVALSEDSEKAWLGRRQEHFYAYAKAELEFVPKKDGEEAGLTIYMNPGHHYEIAKTQLDGTACVILRRRIGSLCAVEKVIPCAEEKLTLVLNCEKDWYKFSFITADGTEVAVGQGEAGYLTTEAGGCFTGNYIAVYASGNGADCDAVAYVKKFTYESYEK